MRSQFIMDFPGFINEGGEDNKYYRWFKRGLDIFSSRTRTGRGTKSFPEMITTSIAGEILPLIRRNTSRIFRLARLRATAFPIFLEAMTPSLFLSNPLGKIKRVQKVPTRCLRPLDMTLSNWRRLANLSLLSKEYAPIGYTANLFRPFLLRLANTFLPPTVEFLLRNPCVRFLRRFFG